MANNTENVAVDDNSSEGNVSKTKKTLTKTVWTDIMTEQLIDSYQEHECLWNMSTPDYKDQYKRSLAYDAIDKVMILFDVKRPEYSSKWTNMRTQFLREYNKHKKSLKSGAGATRRPVNSVIIVVKIIKFA